MHVFTSDFAIHMFDGLESSRSRDFGHHEEVVMQLGKPIRIKSILLDFTFFVNNNPREVSIDGFLDDQWVELIQKTNVKFFAANQKEFQVESSVKVQRLRVKTYPDGGINRIKVFSVSESERSKPQ